jgi:glycogen synthase
MLFSMKALFLTNEYPPHIYGGAGVHVEYLSKELAKLMEIEVRCFGDQDDTQPNLRVMGTQLDNADWTAPAHLKSVFGALQRCLDFNTKNIDASLVHLHTWYSHFGGILAKLNYGVPMVLTVHSLEPLRPWKREQLGGGYDFTVWLESTALKMADAVIAVSEETKVDLLRLFDLDHHKIHVIHNGIDLDEYTRVEAPDVLRKHGVDPAKPYVLFVGRITRQKGILHLANAIRHMSRDFQIVLCAGAPDTPEIAAEMRRKVDEAQAMHGGVIWVESMVAKQDLIALYSRADVFCCPSVYEPFGIINLEAMACQTAVVASAVGGIPEVVVPEETGLLVPLTLKAGTFEPQDAEAFEKGLATGVNRLMADEALRTRMGAAGRMRAEKHFSWSSIAAKTHQLYVELVETKKSPR